MKKILFIITLVFSLFGCNSTPKQNDIIVVPEFVNLGNSCIYGYENPRYIYKEDVATLNCRYYTTFGE